MAATVRNDARQLRLIWDAGRLRPAAGRRSPFALASAEADENRRLEHKLRMLEHLRRQAQIAARRALEG